MPLDGALSQLPNVAFDAPGRAWLALPALLILLAAPVARRGPRRSALLPSILRALALAAVTAVLCEPYVVEKKEREGRVIVLADTSPSVGARGLEQMRAWTPEGEFIAFGARPRVVRDLEPDPAPSTDIAAALRFAAARAGAAQPLRLVLLSDGRATRPGAEEAAMRLRRRDVEIAAVGVPDAPPPAPPSISLARLSAREVDEPGAVPALAAIVAAAGETTAEARLYLDGREVARHAFALRAGVQEIAVPPFAAPPGRYHAQLVLLGDRTPDDNAAATSLHVDGAPRVLCLAGGGGRSLVAEALRAQGMEVEVAAADAPLEGFDAVVVLPGADARALDARAPELAAFVGGKGGGLLAAGGAEGPGLARLANSPLAFLLPLSVEARRAEPEKPAPPANEDDPTPRIEIKEEKTQAYPITLCLVVDRSGSMAGEKIRQAKIAAAAAAGALTGEDRIAVIAFGDEARVVLPPQAGGSARPVLQTLAPLPAEGRTAMFAALEKAYALLGREESPIRHIVLVSDGRPTDTGRWKDLVTKGKEDKVTLSSVGIGFDIDRRLLARLTSWGHGTYWSVVDAKEIPQVVTQDTRRVVQARDERGEDAERAAPEKDERKPEPEERTEPETAMPAPKPPPGVPVRLEAAAPRGMFKGADEAKLPEVAGVEEGEPRFAAWVAARAGDAPLVAYRRTGLGTSGALMVDPESRGGRALREHEDFPRWMAQLVRSVLPDRPADPVSVSTRTLDGGRRLAVQVFGEDGAARTDLPLRLVVGGAERPTVRRSSRYEAELPARDGVTTASVEVGDPPLARRAFVLPPSRDPEMGAVGVDAAALRRLAGGPLTDDVARAKKPPLARTSERKPLWLPFLALAAILLPFDAWARRRARSGSRSPRATPTASAPR